MNIDPTLLWVALAGAWLSLDVTAALQTMVSRPLVASTLAGAICGDPWAGLGVGCLLEMVWLGYVPVGSVIPPDFSLASVFAATAAVLMERNRPGVSAEAAAVWAALCSLPVAWVGGRLDTAQRRANRAVAERAEQLALGGDSGALGRALVGIMARTLVRSFLLLLAALAFLLVPMGAVLEALPLQARDALGWLYWLWLLLGFMVLLDLFWERRHMRAMVLTFVGSALALYVLRLPGGLVLALAALMAALLALLNRARSVPRA